MRRPEPRHTPTLLVDQHRRIGAADGGAQLRNKPPNLRRVIDIAPEEYETIRIYMFEELAFLCAEFRSGTS